MELLIVNPRKRGRKPRRVPKRRRNPARKLKLNGSKPRVRRKSSSKKKAASVSKKKGTSKMAAVRRYKKKARRNAKRRTTAKQRAAARRNIKKAQAAVRKKRKKATRSNPRRAKRSPRRAAKKRSQAKRGRRTVRRMKRRANPSRRRKTTTRRRRSNPKRKGLTQYNRLQKEASRLGISAKGTMGQLEARIAQAKGLSPAPKARRRRKAKGGRKRVSGKHSSWAYSHRKRKVPRRGKKRRRSTSKARVARAYLGAKRVQKGISRGKIGGDAAKMAKAMGLTRVNPVGLKTMWKDLKTVAPTVGLTIGGMALTLAGGMRLSAAITKAEWAQKLPDPVKRNIVPLTTATVTLGSVALIKKVKAFAKLQKYTMPILIGGLSAAAIHAMITTEWGKKLMSYLGFSIAIDQQAMESEAAAGNGAAAAGLGDYMTVSQYLGAVGVDISPMGPSWYGRGDMSPVGDYVDAGPQETFGNYVASEFPVHRPGPGDNINVMAELEGFAGDAYGQEGVFASGYGGAYPEGGYGALELEETPGGTVIESVGEAGIFGGKSVI